MLRSPCAIEARAKNKRGTVPFEKPKMADRTGANDGAGGPASRVTHRRLPLPAVQRHGTMRRGVLAAAAVAAVAGTMLVGASAQEPPPAAAKEPDEYTVKAVFLYSFGRFVQWPPKTFADDSAPFVIGIAGEDHFGRALEEIAAKKTIQDRHIAIRRFATADDYREPCQILFVSRSLSARGRRRSSRRRRGSPCSSSARPRAFASRGESPISTSRTTASALKSTRYGPQRSTPLGCQAVEAGQSGGRRPAAGDFQRLNDLAGFWEKGDWLHLPERPGGCLAQMVPVPFFPLRNRKQATGLPARTWRKTHRSIHLRGDISPFTPLRPHPPH